MQRNGGEKAYYSTTDTFLHKKREVHSAVVKMKRNTSDDESVQTDYVLAEIGSSSEDDDEEGDDTQITVTTTRSGRRATLYLL